jgi:hypothetical protein
LTQADDHVLIWEYFNSACAFCGRFLKRNAEEARIDHLVAASKGGSNALGNRVLSCGPCNDKEKLDQHWELFLRLKSESDEVFALRRERIRQWQVLHPVPDEAHHRLFNEAAAMKATEVIGLFEQKIAELQILIAENSPP